jgi:VanZ family protein
MDYGLWTILELLMNNRLKITLPLLYMGLIFGLSSVPCAANNKMGGVVYISETMQNFLHIPLYGGLAALWLWYFTSVTPKGESPSVIARSEATKQSQVFFKMTPFKRAALYTILIIAVYAASDEFHQSFVPGRFMGLDDWLSDVAGGLIAVGIWRSFLVSKRRGKTPRHQTQGHM